jgi:multidrug efflux pump subunit AcrA (membrane-fusion protein)
MRLPKSIPRPAKRKPSTKRRLPTAWRNWVLGLLCLAVIASAISAVGSSAAGSASTQRTATVGRGVVQSSVSGNGSLEAAQQVELDFGAAGEVTAIYVKAGEEVAKGKVLARIDSSAAQASLASAKAKLAEADEALEAASEAEGVEASTSFEGTAKTVLAAYPQPAVSESEARNEKESSGSGKTESGTTKSGSEAKQAPSSQTPSPSAPSSEESPAPAAPTTAPSESTGGAAPSGEAGGSTQGATVSVATAEANLLQAQLSVKSARQEVRETTLRAPISGTIASVSGAVGETVGGEGSGGASAASGSESSSASSLGAAGGGASSSASGSESSSAFIVLSQLHQLKMEVSFSESDIGKVKVGQPATVSISAIEGAELAGKIVKVGVLPSEGSSSVVEYPATILLTQSANGVRAGMSASAEVVVEQVKDAVTVTSEAVESGPAKTVTVKEEGGKEVRRAVTTGLVGNETTQILSGLKASETVVLPELKVATVGGEAGGGAFPGGGLAKGGGFPFAGGGFAGARPGG